RPRRDPVGETFRARLLLRRALVARPRRAHPAADADRVREAGAGADRRRAQRRASEGGEPALSTATGQALAEVASADWDDLLAELGCADAYFLREYLEGAALLEPGRPTFLRLSGEGGDVLFACLVRDVAGGGLDVTTPYGYGGPVAIGESPPVARFYELYEGWCRERGIVTTFIRFHPLLANH